MLPGRPLHRWLTVALLSLITLFLFFSPSNLGSSLTSRPPKELIAGGDDLTYLNEVLKNNGVGPKISYSSRVIKYVHDDSLATPERPSITEVDQNLLLLPFKDIKITNLPSLPAAIPLQLRVRPSLRPEQVDASMLLFGVSTTYDRFNDDNAGPINEWVRWLTDGHGHSNGAGLILTLFNATDSQISDAKLRLDSVGINATVEPSDPNLDMSGRYVALLGFLNKHPSRNSRKYFALIDDDTFFPHMSKLMEMLSKYSPSKPYYIGTFTERNEWLQEHHAPYAFGGAGIFLTAPLIEQLVKAPCFDRNEKGEYLLGYGSDQGDRLLYNCIIKYTDTKISYQPLLQQQDLSGDLSGLYESGRQPLSMHHYKSWHHFIPDKMHVVADACGEECVLQRWQFKDNFILSNGYSVSQYPKGIDFDTEMMEGTFSIGTVEEMSVRLAYAYGGLRNSLSGTGRKKMWDLLDARRFPDGTIKQVYIKHRGDDRWLKHGESHPENDSIIVLTWEA